MVDLRRGINMGEAKPEEPNTTKSVIENMDALDDHVHSQQPDGAMIAAFDTLSYNILTYSLAC